MQLDRDKRWGASEVERWLNGENVPLPPESEHWIKTGEWRTPEQELKASYPYLLADRDCTTLRELGEGLVLHWDDGVERIKAYDDLPAWIRDSLRHHNALGVLRQLRDSGATPDQILALFASYILPVPEAGGAVDDWVRKTCLQAYLGVPAAQLAMARLLLNGRLPADAEKAKRLAKAAAGAGNTYAARLLAEIERFEITLARAEGGDAGATVGLVDLYRKGAGAPRDAQKILEWMTKAASAGDAGSQFALAQAYHFGVDAEQSDVEAAFWYRKAAEQGHAAAQNWIGVACRDGVGGVARSIAEALEWLRKSANQGDHWGMFNCADLLVADPWVGPGRTKEAIGWLDMAVSLGNLYAPSALGKMYFHGIGVAEDFETAASLFRRGAEMGEPSAQHHLGLVFGKGLGVGQSDEQAEFWHRKAAEQDYAEAQSALGAFYWYGRGGLPEDAQTAVAWFRKAAVQGDPRAQYFLGLAHQRGLGAEHDDHAAFEWYRKSAEQGYDEGEYGLGFRYVLGKGVEKDEVAGSVWLRKAADQGYLPAQAAHRATTTGSAAAFRKTTAPQNIGSRKRPRGITPRPTMSWEKCTNWGVTSLRKTPKRRCSIMKGRRISATRALKKNGGPQLCFGPASWVPVFLAGGRDLRGHHGNCSDIIFNSPRLPTARCGADALKLVQERSVPVAIFDLHTCAGAFKEVPVAIPKAARREHREENFAIFDFELGEAEMREVSAMRATTKVSNGSTVASETRAVNALSP